MKGKSRSNGPSSTVTAGPPVRRRLQKARPLHAAHQLHEEPTAEEYDEEVQAEITRVAGGAAWRRYGMLAANGGLTLLWLISLRAFAPRLFLLSSSAKLTSTRLSCCAVLVKGVIPNFDLIQTDCTDPNGTSLLFGASIALLILTVVVFVSIVFRYVPSC
jgi:hypothetical protein